MTSVTLRLLRAEGGERAVDAAVAEAGCVHDTAYLENIENWVSLDEAMALLAAGTGVSGDPDFARRVGADTVRQHAGSPVATLLRETGSPEAVLSAIALTGAKFSTVTELEALEVGPGRAAVRSRTKKGFTRDPLGCAWTKGLLSSTPTLFGLQPARVEESECQARGGRHCLYEVTWDADLAALAEDPEHRVIALERQLKAMSVRLQSVYATATDLVSPDDLESVLARIVERAANEVRAVGYVLAVRPREHAELQVHARGLSQAEARTVATAEADGEGDEYSLLTAEIVSSRRDYGRLIAVHPAGTEFFDQEQQILRLYAKHAAAVLDMATALQESAEGHAQVSALLSLAHKLARAGTSIEVAERLVEAVPGVVDCDEVTAWFWSADERRLRQAATTRSADDESDILRDMAIEPDDTRYLAQLLDDPKPIFLDASTDDPFAGQILPALNVEAVVIVPLVARDEFLGMLTVSVTERPERLRPRPDLLERLTGAAALGATGIKSGRLVDELEHRARHDDLTGVLNRAGFGQRMASMLEDDPEAPRVGLLFIDLDGFKRVNDMHGHDAGDELLRAAGDRLAGLFRKGDEIARLGGDEFAVALPDVHDEAEVRRAAERVRAAMAEAFVLGRTRVSITASVGYSMWPDYGRSVEALVKQADASMYGEKTSGPSPATDDVSGQSTS